MHLISCLTIMYYLYVRVSLATRLYNIADLASDNLIQRQAESEDLSQSDTSIALTGVATSLQEAPSPTSSLTQVPTWTGTAPVLIISLPSTSSAFQSEDNLASNQEPVSVSLNSITVAFPTINLTSTLSSGIAVSSTSTLDTSPGSTPDSLTSSLISTISISAQVSESLSSFADPTSSTSNSINSSSASDLLSQVPSIQVLASTNSSIPSFPTPIVVTSIVTAPNGGTVVIVLTTIAGSVPIESAAMSPTPSPKSSSASGTGAVPTSLPPAHNIEVLIGGISYHLPSSNEAQFELLLADGTLAQLFMDRIIMHGQKFSIPASLSGAQEVKVGGESITAQPGPSTKPPEENGGGHKRGLFGALGGLIGGVTAAVGSIATLSTGAATFVSGTGGVAASLMGSFPGAITDVEKMVSSLNGIQDTFPTASLSQAGLQVFSNVQSLGRRSLDWMKGAEAALGKFDSLPADTQKLVRTNVGEFVKVGGFLDQTQKALQVFEEFPWDEVEVPTATPELTATPEATNTGSARGSLGLSTIISETKVEESTWISSTTQTRSLTVSSLSSTAKSATPTPSPAVQLYVIITKFKTPVDTFKRFTDELDNTKGSVHILESSQGGQIYLTELNVTQAQDVEDRFDFIDYIGVETFDESGDGRTEEFRATELGQMKASASFNRQRRSPDKNISQLAPRGSLRPRDEDPWWRKMVSAFPRSLDGLLADPSNDPPYLADLSGGKGTTIYILDSGFDVSIPDLQPIGRTVDSFITPNTLTMPNIGKDDANEPRALDAVLTGGDHGTRMAVLAGGKINGFAPNADLFLVRIRGYYKSRYVAQQTGDPASSLITLPGLNSGSRSVVNMSWGILRTTHTAAVTAQIETHLDNFLQFCIGRKIPVVVSAGNRPLVSLVDSNLPHSIATGQDAMIIVGAVNSSGNIWPKTAQDPSRRIEVFAPGDMIMVPGAGGALPISEAGWSGTSQAAAITSGLIAYYYGLPVVTNPFTNNPDKTAKQLVKQYSWLRNKTTDSISSRFPSPRVVYNLARGIDSSGSSCVVRRGRHIQREGSDACSLSTFLTTVKSATISETLLSQASSSLISDSLTIISLSATKMSASASQSPIRLPPSVSESVSSALPSGSQAIISDPQYASDSSISAVQSTSEISTSTSQSASASLSSASNSKFKPSSSGFIPSFKGSISASDLAFKSSISSSQATSEPSVSAPDTESPSAVASTRSYLPSTASASQSNSGPPPNASQSALPPASSYTQSINFPEIIISALNPLLVPSYIPPSSTIVMSSTTQSVDHPAALSSGLGVMLGPQTSVPNSVVWPAPLLPLKTRTKKDAPTTSSVG